MSTLKPQVLFLGTTTVFSSAILAALDRASITRVIEVVPSLTGFPIIQPGSLESIAMQRGWEAQKLPLTQGMNERLMPWFSTADLVLIGCYPERLSSALLSCPRYGAFNLHPSLLPYYRGSSPLFWQLREGCSKTGVTLHEISPKLDGGPVIAQATLPLSFGVSERDLSIELGRLGGRLFREGRTALLQGTVRGEPQNEKIASYYPRPASEDFSLSIHWTVERAVRFARGVEWRKIPLTIKGLGDDNDVMSERVLDWTQGWTWERFNSPLSFPASKMRLRFADGEIEIKRSRLRVRREGALGRINTYSECDNLR